MIQFNEENHEYSLDGKRLPSVTQVIGFSGMVDLSAIPPDILEKACLRGVAVHQALDYLDDGELDEWSIESNIRPYINGYKQFLKDYDTKVIAKEEIVHGYPMEEPELLYAGRLDRVYQFTKGDIEELWVVDIKTGQPRRSHSIQTMAYICGYNEKIKEVNDLAVMRGCLYLDKEGGYKLKKHNNDDEDYKVWESCLRIFHFAKPRYMKSI